MRKIRYVDLFEWNKDMNESLDATGLYVYHHRGSNALDMDELILCPVLYSRFSKLDSAAPGHCCGFAR